MVAPVSGPRGLSSIPGWGTALWFLSKTLNIHSVSLHAGVEMGTSEFNYGGKPTVDNLEPHPVGVEILLIT